MILTLNKIVLRKGLQYLKGVDRDLGKLITQKNGQIKLFSRSTDFEGLINLIIEQQLSVASAQAIYKRIKKLLPSFNANRFYQLKNEDLKIAGLSKQKINYCKGIAKSVIEKELNFNSLKLLPDEEIIRLLTSFRGIGEWTAHCYLLGCLARTDAWPACDLGLQVAIQRVKKFKERPKKLTIEKIAEPWRPFRSVAALLLWSTYD